MPIAHTIPRWRTDLINNPRLATHSWAAETTNRRRDLVTLQTFQGVALATAAQVRWWLSTLALGTPSSRLLSASGYVRAVTNGVIIKQSTVVSTIGRIGGLAMSNNAGRIDFGVKTSTAQVWRIVIEFADGTRSVSTQACWA